MYRQAEAQVRGGTCERESKYPVGIVRRMRRSFCNFLVTRLFMGYLVGFQQEF